MGAAALLTAGCASAAGSSTASSTSTTTSPAAASGAAPTAGLTESFASGRLPSDWEIAGAVVQTGTSGTEPVTFLRLTAAGSPAYVSPKPRLLETGHAGFTFRGRFRVTARTPGRTVGLATVENTRRTENADLFVDARTGRCRIDLFRDDTALSPTRCDDGRWHTVTLTGDFGSVDPAGTSSRTWTLTWTLDGRRMPPVRTTGLAPNTVHRLWVGDATPGKTNTIDWTNLELRLT